MFFKASGVQIQLLLTEGLCVRRPGGRNKEVWLYSGSQVSVEGRNPCRLPGGSVVESREGFPQEDDLFSPPFPQKLYKSSWENQKAKGFELRLDSLAFLAAKANRDLASEVSGRSACTGRCESCSFPSRRVRKGLHRPLISLSLKLQSVKWG